MYCKDNKATKTLPYFPPRESLSRLGVRLGEALHSTKISSINNHGLPPAPYSPAGITGVGVA